MGWNPPNARPSTHLGFTTSTSIILPILSRIHLYFSLSSIDDPWSSDTNGRTSAMTNDDPWQTNTASSNATANPWSMNSATTANNGTGLSVNTSDPWGVGANNAGATTTSTNNAKSIDNELSELLGANAGKSSPHLSFFYSINSF